MDKKKLLLATLLASTLAGSAAYAEDVSSWDDLKSGLSAGGATLNVIQNITGNDVLSVSGKTNTLNLNNNTLSGSGNPTGMEFNNGSNITLTGGGTISNFNRPDTTPASVTGNEFGAVHIGTGSTLTINDENSNWTFSGNTGGLGALNSTNGSIIANVNKIVFGGNYSSTQGGGLRHDVSDSAYNTTVARITASEIEFSNNTINSSAVVGSGAGAMNSRGIMELLGDKVTFTNNRMNATVADSRKYKVGGGAVANQSGENSGTTFNANMTIGKDANSTVTFSGNQSSTSGGAIMNRAVDTDGNATLTINGNTTFSNNTAALNGGAIYNIQQTGRTATVNLNNGTYTFTDNTASQYGGAIYNTGVLTIQKDSSDNKPTFTGNSANQRGGAIYTSNTTTISDAIFGSTTDSTLGNSADEGGAIFVDTGDKNILVSITNSVFGNNQATTYGGAIDHRMGTLNITGSTFANNSAASQGGAILERLQPANAYMNISNSTFTSNTAVSDGGAISAFANLSIENTDFTSNSVTGTNADGGGALFLGSEAVASITGNGTDKGIFSGNISSTRGGAIATRDIAQGNNVAGKLDITNVQFTSNQAATDGGAIYNAFYNDAAGDGYVKVTDSTFSLNSAKNGGAIFNDGADRGGHVGAMNISGGTFTKNSATGTGTTDGGGAIYNAGTMTISGAIFGDETDSTLGNTSAKYGGAIYNLAAAGTVTNISNAKFYNNHASSIGGAIMNHEGTVNISGSTFKNNTADWGGAYYSSNRAGAVTNISNSTFENNSAKGTGAVGLFNTATVLNSTFTGNRATEDEDGGGAVYIGGSSNSVIIDSSFSNNESATLGGAIATRDKARSGGDNPQSSLYITGDGANKAFSGNKAGTNGGAIWTEVKTVVANTNFTNNTATSGNGGAISHTATDSNRFLEIIADGKNVTFSDNKANNVANDIYNTGRLDLIATGADNTITFNGGITGGGDININKLGTDNNVYKVLNGTDIEDKTISTAAGNVVFNGDVVADDLNAAAGTLTNTAELTVNGTLTNAATITDGTTPSGTLNINGGGSSTGTITQNNIKVGDGAFDNDADMTATTLLKNTGNIDNSAIIIAARLENDNIIRDSGATMTGQLKVAGGYNNGAITQKLVQVTGGTFTNNETKTINATTFHNTSAGTYINEGIMGSTTTPITDIYNEGTFTNEATGNIHVATLNNTNTLTNKNDITATDVINSGTFNNNSGADLLAGTITNTAGTFINSGNVGSTTAPVTTISNYSGATFTNNSNAYAGGIVNNGTFDNNAAGVIDANTIDNVAGTFTNKGAVGSATDKVTTISNYSGAILDNQKDIYATSLYNAGTLTNTGATSSIVADVVNNLSTGVLTNEGAISATNTVNRGTFTNDTGSSLLSSTIDNVAGTFTNKGDVGSTAAPVTTIVNYSGATLDNQKDVYATSLNNSGTLTNTGATSSIVAANVNNLAGTMTNQGTVISDNAWNKATLTNDGTFTSNVAFVNDSTVNNTAEGSGLLNVNDGANNGPMTQGTVNIAAGNTGFDNNDSMTVKTALNNAGTFNNNHTVTVKNANNDANLNNTGTINSTAGSSITADTLTNTGGVMNLTNSQVAVVYQSDDILGTINVLGSDPANDDTDLSITGSQPNFAGNLNVGNEANKATLNLNAGNVVEAAIANVASGSVLNVDDSISPGTASVVLNTNDTFAGDVKLASGDVTMKDVNYTTGDTSTTAGGSKPYYEQTGGNLNLENASLTMADASKISAGDMHIDSNSDYTSQSNAFNLGTLQNAGTVNAINGGYENYTFDNLVVGDPANGDKQGDFTIDLYARSNDNKQYDQFGKDSTVISAADPSKQGTAYISDIAVNGDLFGNDAPIDKSIALNNLFKGSVQAGNDITFGATDKEIFTPIGWYKLNSRGGGNYSFDLARYNDHAFRGQVSKIAQYQNQLAIDDMIFNHTMLDQGFKGNDYISSNPNRYASANDLYAPYQYSRKDGGLWVKTYANFEKLQMNQGLNVGNNAYGTIIGADFGLKQLRNGWQFMPTAYVGYNGAHQYWSGTGAYQNGAQAGFLGTWYKKDFMIGALAYGGFYGNEMSTPRGNDSTFNYFAGGATKAAYNWRFHKDWSLQPNLLLAYNFFGQENWHTDFGQMGMMSGMLHGINIAPGLNLIWEKETFSIYATIQYMYNINQSVGGRAGNDIYMPRVSMDRGYLQYGLGINKKFSDRFSGYFQTVIRNVGRNGVGLQLGFNWLLGKGGSSSNNTSKAKKTIKKTNINATSQATTPKKVVIKSL